MPRILFFEWDQREARLLACDFRGAQRTIVAADALPLSEEAGDAARLEQLGELLKQWLAEKKLGRMPAVGVLNRTLVETCLLELPPASDSELPEMVAHQTMRQAPAVAEDAALDFVPFPAQPEQPRKVLAVALAAENVARINAVLKAAGLSGQRLVLRSFAALRSVPAESLASGTSLLIALAAEWVDLTLISDGQPLLLRTVRPPASSDSDSWNQRLMAEVRRTLIAAPSESLHDGSIDRVLVLTAGPTDAEDPATSFCQYLRQQMPAEVTTLSVLTGVAAGPLAQVPQRDRFVGLIAAAREYSPQSRPDVDLLNPRKAPRRLAPRQKLLIAAAAAMALLMVGWYFIHTQLSELDSQIAQLQTRKKDLDETLKRTKKQGELAKELGAWESLSINWLEELRDFSTRVPSENDLVIQRMSLTPSRDRGGAIDIQGVVRDPAIVVQFEQKLRDEFHEIRSKRVQERGRRDDFAWHFESAISVKPRTRDAYAAAAGLVAEAEEDSPKLARRRSPSAKSKRASQKRARSTR